jgi:hypothetical protein
MTDIKITRFNMAELIDISNEVNEAVCKPMGEKVLAAAKAAAPVDSGNYHDTLRLEVHPRTGANDWARVQVVSGSKHGMKVESRHGTLGRALGSQ